MFGALRIEDALHFSLLCLIQIQVLRDPLDGRASARWAAGRCGGRIRRHRHLRPQYQK
jgi:hypothetical protein